MFYFIIEIVFFLCYCPSPSVSIDCVGKITDKNDSAVFGITVFKQRRKSCFLKFNCKMQTMGLENLIKDMPKRP